MNPLIEDSFTALLDRRLRRHNERLRASLIAWSEVLDALGWCVAVKDQDGLPQLNSSALDALAREAMSAVTWSELEHFLAKQVEWERPVQTAEVQVWARPGQGALATVAISGGAEVALTRREAEVLGWLREGKSGPEIALIVGCAARTVERHVAKIYRKWGIHSRAGLLRRPNPTA